MEQKRSLSTQESKVVLALTEQRQREATRAEIIKELGGSEKVADHVIKSLRRKGWLERATWGKYLLIPPEQGPDALGDSNLLALATRIADPYYIGFGAAAAPYGLTTQHRNVRHSGALHEAVLHRIDLVVEGYQRLHQKIERLEARMEKGFARTECEFLETRALIQLSYRQLQDRVETLEQKVQLIEKRLGLAN